MSGSRLRQADDDDGEQYQLLEWRSGLAVTSPFSTGWCCGFKPHMGEIDAQIVVLCTRFLYVCEVTTH